MYIPGDLGIHRMVMQELIQNTVPAGTGAQTINAGTHSAGEMSTSGDVPTSMLWPAYKYFPGLGHSAIG